MVYIIFERILCFKYSARVRI